MKTKPKKEKKKRKKKIKRNKMVAFSHYIASNESCRFHSLLSVSFFVYKKIKYQSLIDFIVDGKAIQT